MAHPAFAEHALIDHGDRRRRGQFDVAPVARHEVLELLFARLRMLSASRFGVAPDDIDEEIHAVIRTLEKVLK